MQECVLCIFCSQLKNVNQENDVDAAYLLHRIPVACRPHEVAAVVQNISPGGLLGDARASVSDTNEVPPVSDDGTPSPAVCKSA